MSVVFYPEMGIDIVAPLMAIKKVNRIYTLGPVPVKRFDKQPLDKTMAYISKLMEFGDTRFDVRNEDNEIVEFFPDVGTTMKSYNFKTTKMWLSQYRQHDQSIVNLSYYYGARTTDPKLPFTEKIDYVVHKDFDFNETLLKNIKPLLKPTTMLVATVEALENFWKVPADVLNELEAIDIYDINKDQDTDLYSVNINDYLQKK